MTMTDADLPGKRRPLTGTGGAGRHRSGGLARCRTSPSGTKAALAGKAAGLLFKAAVRRLPLQVAYPDGSMLGTGGPAPGHDFAQARGVRAADRGQRPDRARRVVHGGGLGGVGPGRCAGGLRRAPWTR